VEQPAEPATQTTASEPVAVPPPPPVETPQAEAPAQAEQPTVLAVQPTPADPYVVVPSPPAKPAVSTPSTASFSKEAAVEQGPSSATFTKSGNHRPLRKASVSLDSQQKHPTTAASAKVAAPELTRPKASQGMSPSFWLLLGGAALALAAAVRFLYVR
jgi:hypothetical protein